MILLLEPLTRPVAISEMLLLTALTALVGWLIARIILNGRITTLQTQIANKTSDLSDCRKRSVATPPVMGFVTIATTTPDNLKIIEGIGPKIEEILNHAGIITFAQLANTSAERIKEILLAHDPIRYRIHDPTTWGQQAALARDGKTQELKHWQDQLNKGKVE